MTFKNAPKNRGNARLGTRSARRIPTTVQAARFDAMMRAGITQRDIHAYLTDIGVTISYPTINHVLWDKFKNDDVEKAVAYLTRAARTKLFPKTET